MAMAMAMNHDTTDNSNNWKLEEQTNKQRLID
jgi:hypothetical protein